MSKAQIQKAKDDLVFVEGLFRKLLTNLPSFKVGTQKALPYGFQKHTRAVSWIAENVVTQNLERGKRRFSLKAVKRNFPNDSLHDCKLTAENGDYFVNVKIHDVSVKEIPSDIAAVKKLEKQYRSDDNYNLIYCVIGVRFEGLEVSFDAGYLKIFSPQFLPKDFIVNLANYKVQARYTHKSVYRSRNVFLGLLPQKTAEAEAKKKEKAKAKKK